MNKLALISLAASAALIPASALANDQTVDPPKRWEDVPDVKMRTPAPPPPPPGTTWPAPPPMVRHSAPPAAAPPPPVVHRVETVRVPAPPPAAHHAPPAHHAGTHDGHGKVMHPGQDRMIVRHGADRVEHVRVEKAHPGHGPAHGGRYGMEWDERDWEYDDDGVPVYVGDGDYYPDEDDYAYVEGHGGYGPEQGYGHPGGWHAYPGYPAGYAYYGMPTVTITETTVTYSSKTCCEKTHVAPKHKVKKRRYKSQPRAHKGERG